MTWDAIVGRSDAWNVEPCVTILQRTGPQRLEPQTITARLVDPESEPVGVTVWPRNVPTGVRA